MNLRNRFQIISLIGILVILLGLSPALVAQGNEETEEESSEKSFSRLRMPLNYETPYITPFPQKPQEPGLSFAGEGPGLLNNRRTQYNVTASWDKKTRNLYYSRTVNQHKIETDRYADYLENARVYGSAEVANYWRQNLYQSTKKAERDKAAGLLNVKVDLGDQVGGVIKAIAGEGTAGLDVTGYQKISFSGRSQWTDKESDALNRVNKFPSLDMEQVSRYSIKGTIGTKISVEVDQNSERKTDLANTIRIRYKGTEDEIIQSIEAGNTNLSLPNTQFVGYSQRVQGLFGIKATAKVGALDLTAIVSQEKGSTESSSFEAGAAKSTNYKRDYDYLERTFFWLFFPEDNVDTIIESEIYTYHNIQSGANTEINEQWNYANVAVEPESFGQYPQEDRTTTVKRLDYDDYYVYNKSLYLEMFTYDRTRLIAGWFRVRLTSGEVVEIGNRLGDTLSLKLIALEEHVADSTYQTWRNEWRNVYSLGARDIDPEGIDVQIYLGEPGTETQPDKNLSHQDGTPYIQIMGLDQRDVTGADNPDGIIDSKNSNILLRDRGYLIFPEPNPFASNVSYAPNGATLNVKVPQIYNTRRSTITGNPSQYTKYYIQFETSQRQTEYYLGRVNIIENSERVILNGEELKKDRDYKIYYEIGRITFLTDAVSDPNADLQIDFEYEPFITSEKKNLFGVRGEYEFNPNFKIGSTVLYKGEKSTDRKPRVGQETSKSLVWDADFAYSTDLPFLTSLTDALPLVEATADSRIAFSGEIAQSRPNPNTAGEAFVDDFESAKETFSLGITRYQYTKSSAPDLVDPELRGKMIWFNPYDPYSVTDIYNRDVRGNDRKTTISLIFDPLESIPDPNSEDECNPDSIAVTPAESWAGIMRAYSTGSQDQTRAQLLEIRMKINNGRIPDNGKIYIDLGDVSEDIDGDGILDTEDKNLNGILEQDEDVGLDGLADTAEACYDSTTNPDPSGDNYSYENKNDYSNINGTEGNRFDASGARPDTEDLDGKGSLNTVEKFFRLEIDLADNKYRVDGSNLNNWITYQIPLRDSLNYEAINNPDWGRIAYSRVWLTGFDSTVVVEIADINLVSTRWEEDSIRPMNIDRTAAAFFPEFNVSAINTEENLDYTPPPGVTGYYDRTTETYEKEQSLLLRFSNLQFYPVDTQITVDSTVIDTFVMVPDTAIAARELFRAEDYAGYKKIRMYVHGPDSLPAGPSPIHFIFRLGNNAENYYQYQTNIYPGWSDSNEVVMDFSEVTLVKDSLNRLKAEDPSITELKVGKYAVKGSPSLTSVLYFGLAVTNTDTVNYEPVSGEIWVDELRVSDVRNDPGTAMRLSVSGGLSDFASYTFNYRKQDEFFRNLTASSSSNLGSGSSETSYSYSAKVNIHKILPPSWGASLPFTYSVSERTSVPRLKPGSDIIVPPEQEEAQTTRSTNTRFSISQSFRKQGGNLLFGLLLNRLNTSYSYSESDSKSPTVPFSHSESYQARATYDMTPKASLNIPILFWLRPIPLIPQSLKDTQLGLLPSRFNLSGTVKKNYSKSINNQNYKSETYNRTLDGTLDLSWNILRSLSADYNLRTTRDIRNADDINISFNPKKFKLGIELDNTQSLRMEYGPSLFKWLTHKFSYRATYRENADPARNELGTRNVNAGNQFSISSTFSPQTFFGRGNKGSVPASDSSSGGGFSLHKPFLKFIRFFTNRIDDINGTYSIDKQSSIWGLEQRPQWKYIFGFTSDPGATINPDAISRTARDVNTESKSYTARTGIRFILGTKINTRYARNERESSANSNKSVSTTWPDLSFTLSNLERYGIIKFFFNTLSLDTKYSQKTDETFRTAGRQYLSDRSTTDSYTPLVKLNFTWFQKLQCSFQYDKSSTLREQFDNNQEINGVDTFFTSKLSNAVRTSSNSWQFSARATLSPAQGIKFPIFGKLQSTLTFNLSISQKNTKSENNQVQTGEWTTTSERTDFTVMPRISYSFSSNINGGLQARWQDSNDKTRYQKSHVRELGIWVEIRF
ncbi:MAG: cell surface protein SprA [candidate division Zixibacteria bacterium]|nr:cell surface protein SprA [candidate division Zixibacteria bacterium]NIR62925.1 cell surface protein SprA [candidate division Zixibacteria bacterium]NIS16062.1 cell surface protein SprA [candidate division Zixibacteria bacterium]NIS44935.1 cell surface protein SprA [candidate division Zixibacteria bacterium]NIT52473.1 cell surface protein SprA [candidate division Zixibacteria bacterium]